MSIYTNSKPWTVPALAEAKRNGSKIVMLTAYDAGFARILDANGVDLILVGDSLGMVVQGHDSTLPVSVHDMGVPHCVCGSGVRHAMLVVDLPFQADASPERALEAATALLRVGAQMIKIEGAGHKLEVISYLVEREIPVCSHLGLTPQSVLRFGGYKVQGRGEEAGGVCVPRHVRRWRLGLLSCYWSVCRRSWQRRSLPMHRCRRLVSVPVLVVMAKCWCCMISLV